MPRWGSHTPLVGRADELAHALAALDAADRGEPSAILLAGEAGVGKTRLLTEIATTAADREALVLVGYCVDLGLGLPYLPFRDVLQTLASDERYAAQVAALPPLAPLVGRDPAAGIDPPALFGSLLALLDTLAADQTVVLVIEDLHWADQASRDLLRFLLGRLRRQRLLVIGSYRSDDVHRTHPLRRDLAELVRLPEVERLEIGRLDDAAIRTLVTALSDRPPDDGLMQTLLQRAEGNAFFAEELVASFADEQPAASPTGTSRTGAAPADGLGQAVPRAAPADALGPGVPRAATVRAGTPLSGSSGSGTPRRGTARAGALPAALSDLLLTRLERLSPAAQKIVKSAAVAGRSVDYRLIRASLPGLDDTAFDEGLQDVLSHHVMYSDDGEVYSFRHALLREAAYRDLLPGERVRLHAQYAAQLAGLRPGPASAADRSHHLYESNNLLGSMRASLEAAEYAALSGAPPAQRNHLEHVLELWPSVEGAAEALGVDELAVTFDAVSAAQRSGDLQRAYSFATSALEQATATAARARIARAHYTLAEVGLSLDRGGEARAHTEEALRLTDGDRRSTSRLWALTMHARAAAYGDDDEAVEAAYAEGVQTARELGRPDIEAELTATALVAGQVTRQTPEGLRELARALELARAAPRPATEQRVLFNLAIGSYEGGFIEQALRWAQELRDLAARSGIQGSLYSTATAVIEVLCLYALGRWDEARAVTLDVLPRSRDSSPYLTEQVAAADGYVGVGRGEPRTVERLTALMSALDGRHFTTILHAGSSLIEDAAWRGDPDDALRWLRATRGPVVGEIASEAMARLGGVALGAVVDAALADAAGTRWRVAADELIAQVRECLPADAHGKADGPETVAWMALAEAQYARLGGDAADRWRAAYDAFGYGERYRQAVCGWRLAEQLAATDRHEAARWLRASLDVAESAGASRLRERLLDLDRRAALGVRASSSGRRSGRRSTSNSSGGRAASSSSGGRASDGRGSSGDGAPGSRALAGDSTESSTERRSPLTARESDVLRLVAKGSTNRQIATDLFISPKTASVHVSNILAKLGAASRTEAASIARDRGLL
ncbi:helix-turn-helix transcriptional regulator [Cumulibacter manganitolerans]|uniref:helix-turn-helix transcriptional regulator n=1 Tax=Cumulibacter manganitolerans TaxID=1884992 RepID=UPI0018862018|nr:helix-turn-helix transcriptional regulator [Cumulibacter manganitolerans]